MQGAASLTDARRGSGRPAGGCRGSPAGFPPPFSFWSAKKKMAVEPSKEKTLVAAQLRARSALPRSGTRF